MSNDSFIVKSYSYFYLIFFLITSMVISVWSYYYLIHIGINQDASRYYSIIVLIAMVITTSINFWVDTRIFMKHFREGDLKSLKFTLYFYLVLAILDLIASPFLFKQGGKGIGIIIFLILLLFSIMQIIFCYLRYKEVKNENNKTS